MFSRVYALPETHEHRRLSRQGKNPYAPYAQLRNQYFIFYTIKQIQKLHHVVHYCLASVRFFYVLKEVSYAHQGCIYLIKNTIETLILWILLPFKITDFYFISCDIKLIFSIFSVFSVTWSFRNHSNMPICCSRNIYGYYHRWWKQLCLLHIFVERIILFFRK